MIKNVLYVGQYTKGTTSRMRAQTLQALVKTNVFDIIYEWAPLMPKPK